MSIITYLHQTRKLLILGLFFCIFPGVMIALTEEGNFFDTNGFYCITVLLFVFVLCLFIDFVKKRSFYQQLSNLLESEELDFVVSIPEPQTIEEELYTKLLYRLKMIAEKNYLSFEEQKEEDMEFVETWVHEIKTPISAAKLISVC